MNVASWPVSDRRLRSPTGSGLYTSVCSAISKESSTSMPRYLTVLGASMYCRSLAPKAVDLSCEAHVT
jgi:hypothetical protein